jgi:outer membrane protein TolC
MRRTSAPLLARPNALHGLTATIVATLSLSACTLQPQPLSESELRATAVADRMRVAAEVPPIETPLSLSEAIARALKYNLDHRTRTLEQAYAAGALKAAYYDLLPTLTASADYSARDNDPIRRSVDSVTGQPDQSHPFISSDRTHTVTQLGLSWNALDFGVSYFNARQQADRILIATERRRKTMHQLIQSVQSAYWRALSAQKLEEEVRKTILDAQSALNDARAIETERLKAPTESLRYQRALLENLRTLEGVQQELAVARLELAGLVNLPVGSNYRLDESATDEQIPRLAAPPEELEILALTNNADLREERYNARIAALEARKALVRLLPSLGFDYGYEHDTDSFLINKGWTEAGLRASSNLLNVLAYPSQKALRRSAERIADSRRVALEMALVTQVHVAAHQFAGARQQFERADAIWNVDDRMLKLAQSGQQAQTDGRLSLIANRTAAILSLLRRYQALANLHAAAGKMQTTLGLEPRTGSLDTISLADLTREVERGAREWQALQSVAPSTSSER